MQKQNEKTIEEVGGRFMPPDIYRSLVEDSSQGFFAFEADTGRVLFFNKRAGDLLGYDNEEIKGLRIQDLVIYDQRAMLSERLALLRANKALVPDRYTYTFVRKDLTTFRAEVVSSKTTFNNKPVVQGTLRDATDYEAFQQRLEHAQRLDTIAVMADGMADQLHKAVEVIRENLEGLEKAADITLEQIKHIAQVKGAGHLIERLSHRLLAFSRGGPYQPQNLNLNEFLSELSGLLRHTIKPSVRLVFKPVPDLPVVIADPSNLQTILSALIANADEAIAVKGRIIISTEVKTVEKHWALLNPDVREGTYVGVGVKDNGAGMSEYVRRRVCEPYFTTKFHGRGLGMAAVYGIVKRHHGWLSIDSEVGRGTWIRFYLPADTEEKADAKIDEEKLAETIDAAIR